MAEANFKIVFDGNVAKQGLLDVRDYAESIAGLERIFHYGLSLSHTPQIPTGREANLPYGLRVAAPTEGSWEQIIVVFSALSDPLAQQAVQLATSYLGNFLAMTLKRLAGISYVSEQRKVQEHLLSEQTQLLGQQVGLHKQAVASHERIILASIDLLESPAQGFVRPIRNGEAEVVETFPEDDVNSKFTVDSSIAEKISHETKLEYPIMYRATVVGLLYPERRIEIAHPEEDRYTRAIVTDAAFDSHRNPYVSSLAHRHSIDMTIQIRRVKETNKIQAIYVLGAIDTLSNQPSWDM